VIVGESEGTARFKASQFLYVPVESRPCDVRVARPNIRLCDAQPQSWPCTFSMDSSLDISYSPLSEPLRRFDVHCVSSNPAHPPTGLIIFVHGGAWRSYGPSLVALRHNLIVLHAQ